MNNYKLLSAISFIVDRFDLVKKDLSAINGIKNVDKVNELNALINDGIEKVYKLMELEEK